MKAVLVIDEMPTDCKECPCIDYEEGYCKVDRYLRQCNWTKNEKSDWCPLRPLPNMENPTRLKDGTYFKAYDTGWNDCLKEITGETE